MTSPSSPVPAVEAFHTRTLAEAVQQLTDRIPESENGIVRVMRGHLVELRDAWERPTPTPGRAAEPDAMRDVERLLKAFSSSLIAWEEWPEALTHLRGKNRLGRVMDADKGALLSAVRTIVARAETAEAQLATQGWQDISTVPQTGDVLLWLRAPHARVEIARWDWLLDCFVSTDEMTEIGKLMPSHWMPLPASPTLSTSRADR